MTNSIDRLPPNNPDSERGLLGCCIYDFRNIIIAFDAGIRTESFYDLRNRDVWQHLRTMEAASDPIDLVTFTQSLHAAGKLEKVGGPVAITACLEAAPVASNLDYHVKTVLAAWALRRVVQASTDAACLAMEPLASGPEIIAKLSQQLEDAQNNQTSETISGRDAAQEWITSVETRQEQRRAGKEFTGIPTGFRKLDNFSSGLPVGGLTIIGARPSVGKTAMLCNIVHHACLVAGIPTTVFSLETTRQKLIDRMAANACDIRAGTFRDGDDLTHQDMGRMTMFAGKLGKNSLAFAKDAFDVGSICSMIARHADLGTKLFLVDYIQIVRSASRGNENKAYTIGSIATAFKQAAIRHEVCVVALAQLKRTDDESAFPNHNDIADSDQLFRDADLMWLLHRPDRVKQPMEGVVVVAKNKDGEVGYVPMTYTPYLLRWEERRENPV